MHFAPFVDVLQLLFPSKPVLAADMVLTPPPFLLKAGTPDSLQNSAILQRDRTKYLPLAKSCTLWYFPVPTQLFPSPLRACTLAAASRSLPGWQWAKPASFAKHPCDSPLREGLVKLRLTAAPRQALSAADIPVPTCPRGRGPGEGVGCFAPISFAAIISPVRLQRESIPLGF